VGATERDFPAWNLRWGGAQDSSEDGTEGASGCGDGQAAY